MPKFFDFDLTLSIKHTFSDHCVDKVSVDQLNQQYSLGKNHAVANLKANIRDFFIHNDNDSSCIATYHNNPDYIAGYVATILGKELTLFDQRLSEATPTIAINYYKVTGLATPLLISYIPLKGSAFNKTIEALSDKNKQIEFLRDALVARKVIDGDAIIDFYEDDEKNFAAATTLNNIRSHFVNRKGPFAVVKSALSKNITPPAPAVNDDVDDFVAQFGLEQYQANATPDHTPITSPTLPRRRESLEGPSSPKLPPSESITPPFFSLISAWGSPTFSPAAIPKPAAAEVKEGSRGLAKSSVLIDSYPGSDNELDGYSGTARP